MKRLVMFVSFVILSLAHSLYANDVFLPQVAFGRSEGGSYYASSITVLNLGPAKATGTIKLFNRDDAKAAETNFDIPLRGSFRVVTPNNTTQALGAFWGLVSAGTATVQATVTMDRRVNDSNSLITTTSLIGTEAGNSLVIPFESSESAMVGMAVANTSNVAVNARVRLVAEDGTYVPGFDVYFPLGPMSQSAAFLDQMFQNFPKNAKGSLNVEAMAVTAVDVSTPTLAVAAVTMKEGQFTA